MSRINTAPKTRAAIRLNDEHFDWAMAVVAILVIAGSIALVFYIAGKVGR